jgi:hypothetical protein
VYVTANEAWHDQLPCGVEVLIAVEATTDGDDVLAFDDHVCSAGVAGARIENAPAANE